MSSLRSAAFSRPLNRFAKPSIHNRWVALSRNDTIMGERYNVTGYTSSVVRGL
jgi:hypothetical protein